MTGEDRGEGQGQAVTEESQTMECFVGCYFKEYWELLQSLEKKGAVE